MLVFSASHLLPIASPLVRGGGVAVDGGRIVAVGRRKDVLKAAGASPEVRELGDAVLMPGLINAHTHLELSWMAEDRPPAPTYVDWVRNLVARRAAGAPQTARAAAEQALAASVAAGTVALADVANDAWAPGVLARSGLPGVAFLEVYGFRTADAEPILAAAAERLDAVESDPDVAEARARLHVELTPHAPHTCSHPLLRALAGRAAAAHARLSIHVAESPAECELLATGRGPMAELLRERGAWDDSFKAPGQSPVEYLDRLGMLHARTLAVHCVHLDHQDVSKLQARGVTVVTCPRSNQMLGVGKAPVQRLLTSGVPVALGTDSLASNTDLSVFVELAALRDEHPELPPAAALRIATLNGATALGLAKDLGSLEPGKLAKLVAVPLDDPTDDALEVVTSNPPGIVTLAV